MAVLPRHAEAAAVLGLLPTGTWVMPETREPDGDGDALVLAETAALHVDRMGEVARVLDAAGIRLDVEVIGVASSRTGRGHPFVHRLAEVDRVLSANWYAAPDLGVVVDAFHL